jgi:hypothetical protein
MDYSDYVVYADESGDHGLATIDADYPVFVLCFCIFRIADYVSEVVPRVQQLKFRFFGHDAVVLHAHEIRKSRGAFRILFDQERRQGFLEAINQVVEAAPFTLIAAVIDKIALKRQYLHPDSPYDVALKFCLESTYAHLRQLGQQDRLTHVVVERRGKEEDKDLELVFRRIVQGSKESGRMSLEIAFAAKEMNSSGLQLADLVAHPIGRHHLRPEQNNRAYDIVEAKLWRGEGGRLEGYGLKVLPEKQ